MKRCLLLIAAIIFLFFAETIPVNANEVIKEPDFRSITAKTEFTLEELLEDYDQLWEVLYESYPFLNVLEKRNINVESLRLSQRVDLETRVSDIYGFVSLLNNLFYRMDYFAHLMLMDTQTYETYSRFSPSTPEDWEGISDGYREYFQQRNAAIFNEQTRLTYQLLKQNNLFPVTSYPQVETSYFPNEKAIYFRFSSFAAFLLERDQNIIADTLATTDEEIEHIIFDITGNKGGSPSYWENHIVSPFGGDYESVIYAFLKETPVNRQYYFDTGLFSFFPVSDLPNSYPPPSFVEEMGLTHFYRYETRLPGDDFTGKTITSHAKRWLLIDGGVYSAADLFAIFCKNTGWATVVGKTTLGDCVGGLDPAIVRLNNTGLLLRFTPACPANSDGTLNAEYGTTPDIYSKPGESPLQTCLRLISNNISK